ncbi:DUF6640 family protein [Mesorhizobium sp.]|uniref:DUF6640 family protein n=1 Tax=Mesorhizobium sp. TaxID=1871066 RepID=UPI000FE9A930|nr:DUF6640 family protein [Mesorhizobium sp.]RWN37584.1 MAG: hypothetical protein EOR95_05200 [Mesorhizobium sp.]
MELAYDSHLLARILLSVATVGYGVVTIKADLNATHATNPLWTPHARFHVVWQVLSYTGVALIALGLIWIAGPLEAERLYLAGGLGAVMYGAFFVAMLSRPIYGGVLYDENGYLPFRPPFGPEGWRWDVNVTVFTAMSAILLLGLAAI